MRMKMFECWIRQEMTPQAMEAAEQELTNLMAAIALGSFAVVMRQDYAGR